LRALNFIFAAGDQVHFDVPRSAVLQYHRRVLHFAQIFFRQQPHPVNQRQLRHLLSPVLCAGLSVLGGISRRQIRRLFLAPGAESLRFRFVQTPQAPKVNLLARTLSATT
jgi:hypothetical protein